MMGQKVLNLNEPPTDGECSCYVMLEKDDKPICRTLCPSPPTEVFVNVSPSLHTWTICEIKPATKFLLSGLPTLHLHHASRSTHERSEWGRFLAFLQKNNRVAAVTFTTCDLYILPPHDSSDFSLVEVLYRRKMAFCELNNQGPASQDFLQKTLPIVDTSHMTVQVSSSLDQKKLNSSGEDGMPACRASRVRLESTHYPREDFCDSSYVNFRCGNSLQRDSNAHMGHNSPDVGLPQIASELSPQESGGRVYFRSSETQETCLQRNFIRADPTYLKTLSQAHSGWIFGAIAELVDNSRDAKATGMNIRIESLYSKNTGETIPVLSFLDDGEGMSHVDVVRMLSFGHKQPDADDPDHIGRFGVGFKTGAMRLGQDAVILTQTTDSRSVALLSQSFNEGKDDIEIPIVSYCKKGNFMEVDTTINSEATANCHLKAIKEFSPFNEYSIGQKLGLFGEMGTGTQVYIWNLAKWGSDYSLEWLGGDKNDHSTHQTQGDILIRSRRIRSRPGQLSQKVPLDYSLKAYLEVIFLEPRMKIYVQGSLVKSRPLAKFLSKTVRVSGDIMGVPVQLTLGRSQIEWEQMNCGMFLYWHGRLIEAYKRVGGMIHSADMGRGIIGVIDVTNVMKDGNGQVWVHSNKQGFQDCEPYAKLEEWLGNKSDEYWDANFDSLHMTKGRSHYKPDQEWVQCDKCRKWRILSNGFDSESLPAEWFCFMPPFNGMCETPEQQVGRGVITVAAKRSGYHPPDKPIQFEEASMTARQSRDGPCEKPSQGEKAPGGSEEDSTQTDIWQKPLKRLRRGFARKCKR